MLVDDTYKGWIWYKESLAESTSGSSFDTVKSDNDEDNEEETTDRCFLMILLRVNK